jgi:hypothetical protein
MRGSGLDEIMDEQEASYAEGLAQDGSEFRFSSIEWYIYSCVLRFSAFCVDSSHWKNPLSSDALLGWIRLWTFSCSIRTLSSPSLDRAIQPWESGFKIM